ncbi:zincin-like metallopeptidase domain-containing protein [Algibacter sp. PT7-4]|uniref:zincin-like metallopeptidase domain-containing protein n=1 Tax=Algibacter ulvanivorans TaxID=3400999 RepID=UPI003AAA929A
MKNSVEKFNSLNGRTVSKQEIAAIRTQAFNEQQFDVFKRLVSVEDKHPKADVFEFEIETPAIFDETAHGSLAKPKKLIEKVKKSVKKQKRKIARKINNVDVEEKSEQYYASLGIPFIDNETLNNFGKDEVSGLAKPIKTDDVYKIVTDRIISAIESQGDLTWYHGRKENKGKNLFIKLPLPINYNINKYYRGINALLLSHYPVRILDKKTNLPKIKLIQITDDKLFWMTFSQIEKNNGKLKKGSVGLEAVYYNFIFKNGNEVITEEKYKELTKLYNCKTASRSEKCATLKKIPFLRYYKVYNEKDIEGIDFEARRKLINKKATVHESDVDKINAAEAIIKSMPKKPLIIEKHIGKGESPNYQPTTDRVVMPLKSQYDNVAIWYGTAFHELVHATGHETRLKRIGVVNFDKFGSPQYAFEELVAELGSAYLNAESGILFHTLKKNAAYIKGWKNKVLSILKKDNKAIFKASGQAQKAADYILDRDSKGVPKFLKIVTSKPKTLTKKSKSVPKTQKSGTQIALFGIKGQTQITTDAFKDMRVSELRDFSLKYYLNELKGKKVAIKNSLKEIVFTTQAGRKIAKGGTMYKEKAVVLERIETLIKNSTYNNFGEPKPNDKKDVLGYLNFKSKLVIDGVKRHVRISITLYKNRKTVLKNYDLGQKKNDLSSKGSKREPSNGENKSLSSNKNTKTKPNIKKLGTVLIDDSTSIIPSVYAIKGDPTTEALDNEVLYLKNNANEQKQGLEKKNTTRQNETINKEPKNRFVQGITSAKNAASNVKLFNFEGELAYFLGKLEKKNIHSLVITLDAPPGSGKTRVLFQMINMVANAGLTSVFFSLEEHPESKLFADKASMYIDAKNESLIDVVGDLPPSFDEFMTIIKDYDFVGVDSWNKAYEKYKVDFDNDLRKGVNGKLIAAIFQRTTNGTMRGGAKAAFDGDVILEVVKEDDFRDSYVQARKNRYQDIPLNELAYNFYSKKTINQNIELPSSVQV